MKVDDIADKAKAKIVVAQQEECAESSKMCVGKLQRPVNVQLRIQKGNCFLPKCVKIYP